MSIGFVASQGHFAKSRRLRLTQTTGGVTCITPLMFDPLWRQRLKTLHRVIVENLGVRNFRDLASWSVAFAAAYWLWVRPAKKEKAEYRVKSL